MEKQTTINLTQDEIEQRLKGVLDSAFKDGMLTWNGGHQLLHRIMCSLKGDDPESLTFAELTSYMPAPECVIVAQTPAPGSLMDLIEAAEKALASLRELDGCAKYLGTGDTEPINVSDEVRVLDYFLSKFKGA